MAAKDSVVFGFARAFVLVDCEKTEIEDQPLTVGAICRISLVFSNLIEKY